ncbi:GDYXXLXY domain-containing protein [Kordia algicida OT-1]|uniref:GDYXXLXY domain-containing protein n=1 Tax=Kordia algicida OT-1 TaxID=391587 RepID=A9DM23_9FLAO|nr:GDYXXLXY domain-containing protein [Kordia algicida]EDP97615.1 hypothetical protein KAOT1_20672 [Kordia algicida OT-1]
MKKTYIYILFGIMVVAQIAASAQTIFKYEQTIASDNVYKFRTAPIDPSDPFRGKYVTLRFNISSYETDDESLQYNNDVYAYFSKDENGFAVLETLSKELLPNSEFDYVKVETSSHYAGKVYFDLPFSTYYMEESKAYDAERLYWDNNRDSEKQNAYAIVHIKDGTHVLTDVIIDGKSLKDAVEK